MCSNALKCAQICSKLLKIAQRPGSNLLKIAQICSNLLKNAQRGSKLLTNAQSLNYAQKCSKMHRSADKVQYCAGTCMSDWPGRGRLYGHSESSVDLNVM